MAELDVFVDGDFRSGYEIWIEPAGPDDSAPRGARPITRVKLSESDCDGTKLLLFLAYSGVRNPVRRCDVKYIGVPEAMPSGAGSGDQHSKEMSELHVALCSRLPYVVTGTDGGKPVGSYPAAPEKGPGDESGAALIDIDSIPVSAIKNCDPAWVGDYLFAVRVTGGSPDDCALIDPGRHGRIIDYDDDCAEDCDGCCGCNESNCSECCGVDSDVDSDVD